MDGMCATPVKYMHSPVFMQIFKAGGNPYHDRLGKFTTPEGAGEASPFPKLEEKASKIGGAIREPDGGFSINPHTGEQPTTGFVVSLHEDLSTPLGDVRNISDDDLLAKVKKFASKNSKVFDDRKNFVGAWHDPKTGKGWLDVSTVVSTAKEARELGAAHDQIAYFDLSKMESVVINQNATSGQGKKL